MIHPWDAEWSDWMVDGGRDDQILVLGLAVRVGCLDMAMMVPADLAEKMVEALSRFSLARFAFDLGVDLEDKAVATAQHEEA